MPDSTRIPASADALVREVTRLTSKDPGDRALLRHSLGKPPRETALGVHRIVVPFLPDLPDDGRKASGYAAAERAYYAVAALIASQPRGAREQAASADRRQGTVPGQEASPPQTPSTATQERRRWRNLGYSLAYAVEQGGNAKSLENHLQLLMRQDADGVYRHLPRLILQLRGDQVHVDWGVLIYDLTRWGRDPRLVAKEWAQSYYRTSERLTTARAKKETGTASGNQKEARS
jgi:CRISPR system Cascade subunit CasB